MKDILDAANVWKGAPIGASFSSVNKPPVAIDDDRTVVQDSGPVTFVVLANDVDPEGQPLNLVSASAALGTAVAELDNTVTYTPPPGISGFDTVVYDVSDDLGQISTGQVNVTINEPALSINTLSNNTFVVTAKTGSIDLTVTDPAGFAGSYSFATPDLTGGPVNLAPPGASGTVATGQLLTATPGLWAHDADAGAVARAWQWRRSGADIPGATAATYTVQASDLGQTLTARETLTDSLGQRSADSAGLGGAGASFTPSDDIGLIAWHDAADAATITGASSVTAWADKVAGGADLVQSDTNARPVTGTRTQNGLNVLDFDGGDFLERSVNLPASGDVAVHIALILDGHTSQYAAAFALNAANDMQIDAGSDTQFDGRMSVTGIGSSINLTGGPFAGPVILSVVFDRTGAATAEVYLGNTLRGSMAYTAALDATQALHLMTNRSRNADINGAVCELVVTSDITNRSAHHDYLAAKWGIT